MTFFLVIFFCDDDDQSSRLLSPPFVVGTEIEELGLSRVRVLADVPVPFRVLGVVVVLPPGDDRAGGRRRGGGTPPFGADAARCRTIRSDRTAAFFAEQVAAVAAVAVGSPDHGGFGLKSSSLYLGLSVVLQLRQV